MSSIVVELKKRISELKEQQSLMQKKLLKAGIEIKKESVKKRFNLNEDIKSLKDIRMATIMDKFTLESYKYECDLLELTPKNWQKEMEDFRPHLIFIESAWQGKDNKWYRKIANLSREIIDLATYCHENNIPVVFWNKEDPIYTDTFMPVARMADYVFTTDIDCIKKYKTRLGHDNVYHLHFAAQAKLHNPIEKYDRKDKYCFAGAYYHRYKNRCKVFDEFSKHFIQTLGLDIYDRNYLNARPEHKFPDVYNDYILGKLDSQEIDIAYKGYNYGINMNSVQQSQTMFARRVFEMLASNTVTIGNYSRGVKNYFGDLTICTDDKVNLKTSLKTYCSDMEKMKNYKLQGLRKVLADHLYEDRLDYIIKIVFAKSLKKKLPLINIIAKIENKKELKRVLAYYNKQTYNNKKLFIIGDTDIEFIENARIISKNDVNVLINEIISCGYIAKINSNDYYGANYLMDMALSLRYGDYSGIGKASSYYYKDNQFFTKGNFDYKEVEALALEASIIDASIVANMPLGDFIESETIEAENGNVFFSIDKFNYCKGYIGETCQAVDDITIHDSGIDITRINTIANKIEAEAYDPNSKILDQNDLVNISLDKKSKISIKKAGTGIEIISDLKEENHKYIYIKETIDIDRYELNNKLTVLFNGEGDLDLICVCIFYDDKGKKLEPKYPKINKSETLEIPRGANWFKVGFRVKGQGKARIYNVQIGKENNTSIDNSFLSRSNVLILTNVYPSADNLYRNMFVHSRVAAYKDEGLVCDVMKMNIYSKDEYSEYSNINIVEGQEARLLSILRTGFIDRVCIHFLDEKMWSVLKHFPEIKKIIWVHGVEIQPWWRREYNYKDRVELNKEKERSARRQAFWQEVFNDIKNNNLYFIFVSKYFAKEIFEDNKISLNEDQYSIIHNLIDTDKFSYIKKTPDQRKKLLSIRPFASNKYANDLTVKIILELSKKPYFNELEFLIIGRGELFDEILKPIKKFKNVILKKDFLRRDDISSLHKGYGIFLTPTRMDAQGVSRDEAMSSGLVPVTNKVAAIPEFTDDTCAILAPSEDYVAMAEGIDMLYKNPEKFLEMSEKAAKRVRGQSSKEFTIDKEIALIVNNIR